MPGKIMAMNKIVEIIVADSNLQIYVYGSRRAIIFPNARKIREVIKTMKHSIVS